MIFYEAPHKLRSTLDDMLEAFGRDRRIALCRELTKLNEDTERTTLGGAVDIYKEREPRGEYVLVIEGGSGESAEENPLSSLTPEEHVAHYEALGMKRMDAIKAAAKDRGVSKSDLYKLLID
jgi:16S rRNA (cytidine1402-2'-O)-methyltransferase